MASAEKLLHEAQFAFASITYGESRANRRNRKRAISLCRKIIRSDPSSMEASEAFAILQRLGQEAYLSNMQVAHRHVTEAQHHGKARPRDALARPGQAPAQGGSSARNPSRNVAAPAPRGSETLDWGGLLGLVLATPKAILGILAFAALILFSIFGPLLIAPLVLLVLFTGPFRSLLNPKQREQVNTFVVQANAWIAERRRSGAGLS